MNEVDEISFTHYAVFVLENTRLCFNVAPKIV